MTRPFIAGLTLIAAALLLGVAVHLGLTRYFDLRLMHQMALVRGQPGDALIAPAQFLSSFGLPGARTILVVLFLLAMLVRHHPRSAMIYTVTVVGSITAHTALKLLVARPRPMLTSWLDDPRDYSFPSGHAAGMMVVLLLAALLLERRWLTVPAVALAVAIGLTRPMLGVHWPTDVIGGWLFGAGSALIGVGLVEGQRGAMRIAPSRRTSSPLK